MKTDRHGDAAIERMLGAGLRASADAADACPEAGDLAAFVEGGLSTAERETIAQHAAACTRCQHALAVIGSMPQAAIPATSAPRVAWFRWAIPVAAVAVVILLYVGIRSTLSLQAPRPATGRPIASSAPVAERAPIDLPREPAGPGMKFGADKAAPGSIDSRSGKSEKRVARADTAAARNKVRPTAPVAPPAAAPTERIAAAQVDSLQNAPARVRPGVAGNVTPFREQVAGQQAPAQAGVTQVQAQAARAIPPVLDRLEEIKVTAAPAKATAGAQVGAQGAVGGQFFVAPATAPVIVAPGQSIRWRIEPGGGISRSRDGGLSWDLQYQTAPSTTLLAGSAPASTVCWIVGSAGTVLLTTDGERWQPRPFPGRVDLVAVEARDALHAAVTARDGRRFVTDDGGATWR